MGNLSNLFSIILFNHATRLTKPLTEIHVPPTVHGILASRIDALPASEKGLLQTLAVIGKDFPLNLVRQITASPDDWLEPILKGLQAESSSTSNPHWGNRNTPSNTCSRRRWRTTRC
jgi:predicted ATPase